MQHVQVTAKNNKAHEVPMGNLTQLGREVVFPTLYASPFTPHASLYQVRASESRDCENVVVVYRSFILESAVHQYLFY